MNDLLVIGSSSVRALLFLGFIAVLRGWFAR